MVSAERLEGGLSKECVDALLGLTNRDKKEELRRKIKNFGWGKTIIREGEQGSNMYVVISGQGKLHEWEDMLPN